MESSIRILHISDLHERAERESEAWRRRRVLGDAWLHHLDELCIENPIDIVLFTGDAADWGRPTEFSRAGDFLNGTLERLSLSRDRLFVVPGNHDVDRSVEADTWAALRGAMGETTDLLGAVRWMSGGRVPAGFEDTWRASVAKRLDPYRRWVRDELKRPDFSATDLTLGYQVRVDLPHAQFPIYILGLNTAWLCGDGNDSGKLWILDEQLMRIASSSDGKPLPGFRILMMHHPFEQMADGPQCRRLLQGQVDLVLRGHLHDEELKSWTDPDSNVLEFAAGCLYEGWHGDQWLNACHVITLEGENYATRAEIRFRTWSARGGHWHDDNGLYKTSKGGRVNWAIPRRQQVGSSKACSAITVNPWKPALRPAFFGRHVLLAKLNGAWSQGRSVSLVGDWRIGKSSILATCFDDIKRSGRPVRFLDGESTAGASPSRFVETVTGLKAANDSDGAADVLAAWARQERRPGLLPLLLVDECDAIVRRFEYRFFERLRGMLDELCLGVSSRRELDHVFKDSGKGASPFQNRLELHWVGLLESDAADQLVEAAGASLTTEARRLIHEWGGRHPFFIQLMARKQIDACEFGQTSAQALEEFQTEASARLRELWNTLTEKEQRALVEAGAIRRPTAATLRRRGLLDETGRPFGRVLTEWLANEAV